MRAALVIALALLAGCALWHVPPQETPEDISGDLPPPVVPFEQRSLD